LWEAWQAVRDDPEIRVLVMKGAGERAFSAGADITEFGTAPSYVAARQARHDRDLWPLLLDLPKPSIAAIHGFALGGGLELSLYCDFRIAAEDALLGLPEVGLGYLPSAGGTQMLPRIAPPGVALQMVLSGDPISAADALALGLVHRVVPRAGLLAEVAKLAAALAALPGSAVSQAKRALNAALEVNIDAGLAFERACYQRASAARRGTERAGGDG
jgi:enoyl-CoA hydratase/carnithine racemase